jgi:HEPN domain-containing protein
MIESGCLLAQQSIESYLKGIAHSTNLSGRELYYFKKEDPSQTGKIRIWGHNLTHLVQALLGDNSALGVFLSDKQMASFLEKLTESYEPVRYGEASPSAVFEILVQEFDRAVQILDGIYHEKMGIKAETRLYVPSSLRTDFLRNNKVFPQSKITAFPMANLAMGVDLTPLEKKFNFDKGKVVQQASGRSDKT